MTCRSSGPTLLGVTAKPYDSDPLSDLSVDKDTRLVINADGELVLAPSMRPSPAPSLTDDLEIAPPDDADDNPSLLADEGELGPMEEGLVVARAPAAPAEPAPGPPTLAPFRAEPAAPRPTANAAPPTSDLEVPAPRPKAPPPPPEASNRPSANAAPLTQARIDDLTPEPPPPPPLDDAFLVEAPVEDEPMPLPDDAFEAPTERPDPSYGAPPVAPAPSVDATWASPTADDLALDPPDDEDFDLELDDGWSDPEASDELLLTEDDVVSSRSSPAADAPFASLLASAQPTERPGKLPPFPPPAGTPAHGTAMPDLDRPPTKPSDPFVGSDAETPAVPTPDLRRHEELMPVASDLVHSPSKIEATVSPLEGAAPAEPKPRRAPARRPSFSGRKIREKSRSDHVGSRVQSSDIPDNRAEPYFARGLEALEAGDLQSAERDLAIAMTYAPSNERYRAAFAELKRRKGR